MLLMPLSGYVASNFSKYGVRLLRHRTWSPGASSRAQVYAFFNTIHVTHRLRLHRADRRACAGGAQARAWWTATASSRASCPSEFLWSRASDALTSQEGDCMSTSIRSVLARTLAAWLLALPALALGGALRLRAQRRARARSASSTPPPTPWCGEIAAGKKPRGIAISPDGRTAYVSDQPNNRAR